MSSNYQPKTARQFGSVTDGNYSWFDTDGQLHMEGTARCYDDLQGAVSLAKLPAVNDPTWRTFNYGITSGVTFPALGFALNDYMEFFIQSNHEMELSSILNNHIHWTIPTDSADDKIKFQLDVISAPINGTFAAVTGSPFSAETTLATGDSGKHKYLDVADIPAVNTTVSTIYICRLTRVAASASDYSGEVYVLFNDSHFLKNTLGTTTESAK